MSEPAPRLDYSPWSQWRAADYLSEYYSEVMPDEQFALAFLQESLERLPEVSLALDYGCGPTVHHAVALVGKAREIHLAEYLDDNLAAVRMWLDRAEGAHDWSPFTRHILQTRGMNEPSPGQVAAIEQEARGRITRLAQSDAGDSDPLGSLMRGSYPLVTTHYCAEGATNDKQTWALYMRNISSLVQPGGTLIVSSCGAADYYAVGDNVFPCAGVTGCDLLGCLQENGFRDIDMRVRGVPDHSTQGYSSVIFASAVKAVG